MSEPAGDADPMFSPAADGSDHSEPLPPTGEPRATADVRSGSGYGDGPEGVVESQRAGQVAGSGSSTVKEPTQFGRLFTDVPKWLEILIMAAGVIVTAGGVAVAAWGVWVANDQLKTMNAQLGMNKDAIESAAADGRVQMKKQDEHLELVRRQIDAVGQQVTQMQSQAEAMRHSCDALRVQAAAMQTAASAQIDQSTALASSAVLLGKHLEELRKSSNELATQTKLMASAFEANARATGNEDVRACLAELERAGMHLSSLRARYIGLVSSVQVDSLAEWSRVVNETGGTATLLKDVLSCIERAETNLVAAGAGARTTRLHEQIRARRERIAVLGRAFLDRGPDVKDWTWADANHFLGSYLLGVMSEANSLGQLTAKLQDAAIGSMAPELQESTR